MNKQAILLQISLILLFLLPVCIYAGTSVVQTTDAQFNAGDLYQMQVNGSGEPASLQLKFQWETYLNSTPTEREGCGMAYNPDQNKVLIFGGNQGGTYFNDTREYNVASAFWQTPLIRGLRQGLIMGSLI